MMSRGEGHPCRIKLHFLKNHQVIISSGEWAGTCLGKTCSPMKDSPHHSAILVHVYSAKQEISLRTAASKKNIFRPIALQQHCCAKCTLCSILCMPLILCHKTSLLEILWRPYFYPNRCTGQGSTVTQKPCLKKFRH